MTVFTSSETTCVSLHRSCKPAEKSASCGRLERLKALICSIESGLASGLTAT